MTRHTLYTGYLSLALTAVLALSPGRLSAMMAPHYIPGLTNTTVTLTATDGYISTGEGDSHYFWGLAAPGGGFQYPSPTFTVPQGSTMHITLDNTLPVPVSLLFPGQEGVTASGGQPGLLTREAPTNGSVTYTFTVSEPGTYFYHSGTQPDLEIEMGIVGALIVRPTNGLGQVIMNQAYNHTNTVFDHEFLFLLTDMDERVHHLAELGCQDQFDFSEWWPVYWFINGRNAPDTMAPSDAEWLPNQPYNCMPMLHPGQKLLMRMIGGGRDPHPHHTHGNNADVIAINGRMLESAPGAGPDLRVSTFTIPMFPGETADAIFTWTGYKLGWDIYGHTSTNDPLEPFEYAPDHGKPLPVVLPNDQQLTYGPMYGGSPFLGGENKLPPGEGGFNSVGAFMYMSHSHNEKEMVNYDIFPGGMMTMFMVVPHSVTNGM